MGLFSKSVKKMQAEGDLDGLVNYIKSHPSFKGVDAVTEFGARAVPGLLTVLSEGSPSVPAALARIGQPSMAGLTAALSSGNPIVQRDAAAALLAMVVHGGHLNAAQVEALAKIERESPYLETAAVAIAAHVAYEERSLHIANAEQNHKHPNLGNSAEVTSLAKYVASIGTLAFPSDPHAGSFMGGAILYCCRQSH